MAWAVTAGAVASGNDVSSLASNAPAGVSSGDLLVLMTGVSSSMQTITTPTGWTLPTNGIGTDGFSAVRGALYYRIADGTSDDTPTVSYGGTTDPVSVILRITGQHDSSYFDECGTPYTHTSGTTVTLPTVTTDENGELMVAVSYMDDVAANSTPSGWTERATFDTAFRTGMRVWTKEAATAGSNGGETHTMTFSDQAVALNAAFKPAAGGGATPKNVFGKMLSGPFGGAI